MAYTVVKSFERGLDTRKMLDTTEAGSLLQAKDCHITRGGEVEKRAAFVVLTSVPDTIGMYAQPTGIINVWGNAAHGSPPHVFPAKVRYWGIPHPEGATLTRILSVEEYSNQLYVVALYDNGDRLHWYGDPPAILFPPQIITTPPGGGDPEPVPGPTAGQPRATFTFAQRAADAAPFSVFWGYVSSTSGHYEPGPLYDYWVPDYSYPLIDSTNTTGQFYPDAGPLPMTTNDPATWASELAALINAYDSSDALPLAGAPKWRANANGPELTIWADETTARMNSWPVYLFGNGCAIVPEAPVLSGGQNSPPVMLAAPRFAGNPKPLDNGSFVLAHNERLFAVNQNILNFSQPKSVQAWDSAHQGGFIDMTMWAEGTPELVSLADYGGDLAVFARRHIMIWHTDILPSAFFKRQILHRTGLVAPQARVPFGQNEVIYLDRSGVRSLRTRSGVQEAFASDLGDPIDVLVRLIITSTSQPDRDAHYWADVEPRSGRLWMALWHQIFVLSYFPNAGITAWSWYDAAACPVDMLNATDDGLYFRSGDDIIAYGGCPFWDASWASETYDATEAVVRSPYIDASKPATHKNWTGLDAALLGDWQILATFDPTQATFDPAFTPFDLLANVTKSTYAQQKIAMNGQSPVVSLELRTTYVGPARIGNLTVHYDDAFAD